MKIPTKRFMLEPWPSFSESEANIVKSILLSNKVNYWTGKEINKFEKEFSKWVNVNYSVALANGTLALEVTLKALGIGPGDEVIVTPRSFIASVSCVINVGATPVFVDVNKNSGNIDAETILNSITKKTKAVICVHLSGWPCDMDPIMSLAKKNNIKVIEDCAQAHGATYKGRSVGSIGHVGVWSFCQDKIMTTGGEGGMITTNDKKIWSKVWSYKDHGKNYNSIYRKSKKHGFKWVHDSFGTNMRMLEMQAGIGIYQLKKIKSWTKKRNQNAHLITKSLTHFSSVRIPEFKCNINCKSNCSAKKQCTHAFYKFYFYVDPRFLKKGWSRDRILKTINSYNIPCFQGSCSEIYLEKAFKNTNFRPLKRMENAKNLGETSLMLLVHPTINKENLKIMVKIISEIFDKASLKN